MSHAGKTQHLIQYLLNGPRITWVRELPLELSQGGVGDGAASRAAILDVGTDGRTSPVSASLPPSRISQVKITHKYQSLW